MKPLMKKLSPRWRKLLGDARAARGRLVGIGIAMGITMALVAAILTARAILAREMNRNYLGTNPPSAVLSLDEVSEELLQSIRSQPGIVAAERRATLSAQTKLPSGDPIFLSLRVVSDFSALSIAKFYPEAGAWPPSRGEILIERAVARMMPIDIGAELDLELPSGAKHTLRIAGSVHDPGEAPAWQDRVVYGYITLETLATLDALRSFDELQVVTEASTVSDIEAMTRKLSLWLREQGRAVHFIRIPPPGQHPHQWQIDSVARTLLSFGVLAVVLEAALLTIVIGGLLAPQVRQIAVMKALGARTRQIIGMYSTLVLALAFAALSVALPIGILTGKWFAGYLMGVLNFDIGDNSVPASVFELCIALGLLVPFCASLWSIVSAARKSVRESIDHYGVSSRDNNRWLQRLCNRVRANNVSLQLAVRNLARRKSQFALALTLLVLTGTTFMLAGNLLWLWRSVTSASIDEQRFDIQVSLRQPRLETSVIEALASIPGVRAVESTQMQWANSDAGDELSFSTRSLPLRAVAPGSTLQKLEVAEGRWLNADDEDAVVLNSAARANLFPDAKLGASIALIVNRKPVRLRIVGIARELFGSAQAYTTKAALTQIVESNGMARAFLVGLEPGVDADATARAIEAALAKSELPARGVYTKASMSMGITMHTYIFVAMMLLIVTSIAKIATAGLASCMSTAVLERTREFGVMRTLGARAYDIQNSIVIEALVIGGLSWVLALLCAAPLTVWTEKALGAVVNRPFPVVFSPIVAFLWVGGVALLAIVASVAPAKRASKLTVRETLMS